MLGAAMIPHPDAAPRIYKSLSQVPRRFDGGGYTPVAVECGGYRDVADTSGILYVTVPHMLMVWHLTPCGARR